MFAILKNTASLETAKKLGLIPEEYNKIIEILGREPNFTELSIFSVMWSEHCSYKNSIHWLKKLPKDGKHVLAKAGEENAGMIDIGDNMGCVFKIESHNHPSAIEPYQGAATGVGGIHRDIFTMGARPIAALNSLRFGNIDLPKTKWIAKGVVKGIGHYGNAFGVPTVAGEVYFDDSYNINPLVNAMSVGIVEKGKTISATSKGVGNPVYIVGSATGKDGIHGATFASGDLHEDSADDLPAVQVGDPFQEKLLLEATLELIDTGAVVGMQDMGAAGITCSTSEMSAKDGFGMKIWLDRVPTRQKNMKPFEILLSESQERMLVVVEKGREHEVEAVFDKWDLHCTIIGEVTEGGMLEYFMDGEQVAHVPAEPLVLGGGAPVYYRESKEPEYFQEINKYKIEDIAEPKDLVEVAKHLSAEPNIASKKWIYEQYDSMVQTNNTSSNNPSDAAVVRIKGSKKALAVKVDCNPYYVFADPHKGTAIAVSEAARNIICSGGEPAAITNNLNFGNPYNPEVYYQFTGAIMGMSEACIKFDTPVTGGNVSFYNQSADGGAVMPTPTIGMLGILADYENRMGLSFQKEGDLIYLIGESKNDISSSQYLIKYHKTKFSPAPFFELDTEFHIHQTVKMLIKNKAITSAHDVSDGGLFICLMESAMPNKLGFEISSDLTIRKDAFLFGEAQSRVVVSVSADKKDVFENSLKENKTAFSLLGKVTSGEIKVDESIFGDIAIWADIYDNALARKMEE
ncbi:MAG: phosphoribosylformylglycinamidine synthase subunit PurL [Sphingobacteriales bacterium]|nr:MAG: phosphoribosylformylglycinamidine synthase subunit PurL [Sphingobacteriales bacterium]